MVSSFHLLTLCTCIILLITPFEVSSSASVKSAQIGGGDGDVASIVNGVIGPAVDALGSIVSPVLIPGAGGLTKSLSITNVGTNLLDNGLITISSFGIFINTSSFMKKEIMDEISSFIENLLAKLEWTAAANLVFEVSANFDGNSVSINNAIADNNGFVYFFDNGILFKTSPYLPTAYIQKAISFIQGAIVKTQKVSQCLM